MRWQGGRRSDNVEDRRGAGLPRGVRVGGMGGIGIVVLALVAMFFGVDPSIILQGGGPADQPAVDVRPDQPAGPSSGGAPGARDEVREFVAVVLADTEDVWTEVFRAGGRRYQPPTLVLFSRGVQSACGMAGSAVGPFYCPEDRQVYLDTGFFQDLKARFRAPGDFAQAYVIAHEVGHHVQNLIGVAGKVQEMRSRARPAEANLLSVRMELQADCLAGMWATRAQRARQILEAGDLEEALNAASAIGDDRIQRQTQGQVVPESFTHGSSAQRVRWFKRGLEKGDLEACNTFNTDRL